MSQVLLYIPEVIVARRCQTGSRPLTGAAHPAHSSDVLKWCLQFPLLCCLPGAGGPPDLCCVHGLLPAVACPYPRDIGALPWQRLGVLRTLNRLRHQGSARGQHSCRRAVRVVILAAKISSLVGRFSFLVPLLAAFFFFSSPFFVTASPACLASSWPARLPHFIFPSANELFALWPATSQPCPTCPKHPAFQHPSLLGHPAFHSRSGKPTAFHSGCLSLLHLSASLSLSLLKRCGMKREEAFAFVLGGYLRLPVA